MRVSSQQRRRKSRIGLLHRHLAFTVDGVPVTGVVMADETCGVVKREVRHNGKLVVDRVRGGLVTEHVRGDVRIELRDTAPPDVRALYDELRAAER